MRLRVALGTACAVSVLAGFPHFGSPAAHAQAHAAPPADGAKPPLELFKQAREEIRDGRFDVAAETLKRFLAANPTDRDFLELTAKEPTVFLRLRNVPVWSDNPAAQAEAKKLVEEIIAKSEEANKKLYRDPARIARFTRNLGESLEERLYAEQQLKLGGDAVAPVLIDTLRTTSDINLRAGIYSAIGKLNVEQLPGILAAVDGVDGDLKLGLLRSLVSRGDSLSLLSSGDTDYTPHLWYYSASKAVEQTAVRDYSRDVLDKLTGGSFARRQASAELVRIATPYAAKRARFRSGDTVKIWTWDPAKLTIRSVDATGQQAADYFGVRDLRWALERSPNDLAAQELFLSLTVERAVEKSQFGELATADPDLYAILAATPSETLIGLLDRAIGRKQTPLVLGLTQALAARSDRSAVTVSATGRPPVLVKALDYPDARVQLAAAVGLLRVPGSASGQNTKIVEILRRAATVEATPADSKETGRALIADPDGTRAGALATQLRSLGYSVEHVVTGRELSKRIAAAADVDLVFVDRHVVNPELRDLIPNLVGNSHLSTRPIFIVASTDAPRRVPLEVLLLRLAVLIAVTETSNTEVPAPFFFDARKTPTDTEKARADLATLRDRRLRELYTIRLARLERLVAGSGLPQSLALQARLGQRLPQLTYAALAAEYPVTPAASPETYKLFDAKTRAILLNPQLALVADRLPMEGVMKLVEELEASIDAPRKLQAEQLLARLDPVPLGLPTDSSKDPLLEEKLGRFARSVGGGTVVSESYSAVSLAQDIRAASADPASLPRSAADKRRGAKIAAEYLRRMATGEIPGYDLRPAESTLRQLLRDDELADAAIDAVGKLPSAESQQDLLTLAVTGSRPPALRLKAADRLISHIRANGNLTTLTLLDALKDASRSEPLPELRARLAVVQQLLSGNPDDLTSLILKFPLPLPPAPVPPAPPKDAAPVPPEAKPELPKK